MWNFSIGASRPSQSAVAPGFDTTPGVLNSLDLVVDGSQALFGVNGQLAGTIQLPEDPTTGDVYASTGFLGALVSEGRIVSLTNFSVFTLPGEEATPEAGPAEAAQGVPPARPLQLISGTCETPGELVFELLEATYPVGEPVGSASSVVAETSFTRAPFLLSDLMATQHAILASESFDAPGTTIACADIGGIADELGGFVIGLTSQNDSGYAGTVFMAADDANATTNISVFLSPVVSTVSADVETSDEAATVDEIVAEDQATPDAALDPELEDIVTEVPVDGAVIQIETEATPAA